MNFYTQPADTYEDCPFDYVSTYDTPECDRRLGEGGGRVFREDFLDQPFFWDE